jgi:hypothetical protein
MRIIITLSGIASVLGSIRRVVSFSAFRYRLLPRSYVVPLGEDCNIHVIPKGSTGVIGGPGRTVVGTSFLQYIISHFVATDRTFGACHISDGRRKRTSKQ